MKQESIGVGVIGCGEIAQLMHLPYLFELPAFRIAALCDVSRGTLDAVGATYGVDARYADHRALLADASVDAVVISTYDHGPVLADVIAAGKHVIVEKPLAFTPDEARPLVAEAERRGIVALVGYMKFYDPGYEIGLERIAAIGRPKSIHVHDFAGRFDRYGKLYTQAKIADVAEAVVAAGRKSMAGRVETALRPDHAGYRDLYLALLGLGSHDLAVMRGAFGPSGKVAFARETGRNQLVAVLDYDGVPCLFDMAFAQYEWWDEWMHVHGEREEVRITFQNPYVRHATALVTVREPIDGAMSERVIRGAPDTAFRRQWQHFADCIRGSAKPRTPLAGGVADLDLAVAIIKAMPPKPAASGDA
jgi:predicted dehydrogenase